MLAFRPLNVMEKHLRHQKAFNSELNDSDQELGLAAVGVMWPVTWRKDDLVTRFASTMALLNLALTRSAKRAHAATLASVAAILAKLSADQIAKLIPSGDKKATGVLLELGLHDFLTHLKRIVESPKLESLREHGFGCVVAIMQHPKFVVLCRDQLSQILQILSKDGSSSLSDRATELQKSL
ncbi:unnamed protein product [Echinostoma caproni]|uniref:CLASP_N domain-containing protein n=1 Tax=Echinostoma caproni TaxID=27848 RepID=A0A183B527_9TREM|nr:unnamed protein product [Echinostoma caproni]